MHNQADSNIAMYKASYVLRKHIFKRRIDSITYGYHVARDIIAHCAMCDQEIWKVLYCPNCLAHVMSMHAMPLHISWNLSFALGHTYCTLVLGLLVRRTD